MENLRKLLEELYIEIYSVDSHDKYQHYKNFTYQCEKMSDSLVRNKEYLKAIKLLYSAVDVLTSHNEIEDANDFEILSLTIAYDTKDNQSIEYAISKTKYKFNLLRIAKYYTFGKQELNYEKAFELFSKNYKEFIKESDPDFDDDYYYLGVYLLSIYKCKGLESVIEYLDKNNLDNKVIFNSNNICSPLIYLFLSLRCKENKDNIRIYLKRYEFCIKNVYDDEYLEAVNDFKKEYDKLINE